jgi:CRISPR/Cas system CMR subunit Cmr4 (Cas7 group RAMP superfamily)
MIPILTSPTIATIWPEIRTAETGMESDRASFDYFSNEYAQALQAIEAIEKQASTILVLGGQEDLRKFVEQFLEMATRVRAEALEKGETNFAEWFEELVKRGEAVRLATVPR